MRRPNRDRVRAKRIGRAMRTPLALALVLAPTLASRTALAQPGPDRIQPPGLTDAIPAPPPDVSRDTHRWMIGGGFAAFANFPMSMGDEGGALYASKPLWLGNRYRFFQWASDLSGIAGFGTYSHHAYALVGPTIGCNLYFGSVFGLEFRTGLDAMAQIGPRTVVGLTLGMSDAFVFRFWKDDRKRLKLLAHQHFGGYFASDPGNDMGMNAGMFGLGLAYEQPL